MNNKPYYLISKNRLFQLYLMGLKGFIELPRPKPRYNRFKSIFLTLSTLGLLKYILQNWKIEFETLNQPNFLIPRIVYRSREEHYKYWELSRLARNKNGTFSHYNYDSNSDFVFYTTKQGEQTSENYNLTSERLEIVDNLSFEPYIRDFRKTGNIQSKIKANQMIAYNRNLFNGLDLKNHLMYKTVNLSDLIRTCYFIFYTKLGLTNHYRYDHISSKSDMIYEYEKLKLALNLPHKSELNKIDKLALIHDEIINKLI